MQSERTATPCGHRYTAGVIRGQVSPGVFLSDDSHFKHNYIFLHNSNLITQLPLSQFTSCLLTEREDVSVSEQNRSLTSAVDQQVTLSICRCFCTLSLRGLPTVHRVVTLMLLCVDLSPVKLIL